MHVCTVSAQRSEFIWPNEIPKSRITHRTTDVEIFCKPGLAHTTRPVASSLRNHTQCAQSMAQLCTKPPQAPWLFNVTSKGSPPVSFLQLSWILTCFLGCISNEVTHCHCKGSHAWSIHASVKLRFCIILPKLRCCIPIPILI